MPTILPDLLTEGAQRAPDQKAFSCGNEAITYRLLNERSDQLAAFLQSQNVLPGDRVAILLNRSLLGPLAIYAVLKTGAIYVPLDHSSPPEILREIITDCEVKIIISDSPFQEKLSSIVTKDSSLDLTIIGTETGGFSWKTIQDFDAPFISRPLKASDRAYLLYTSGSTGSPKGIIHTHESGLAYARLASKLFQITSKDRIGSHSPIHFDMSTFGLFAGPYATATTIIIPDAHIKFPASLAALIESEQITIWYSVPFVLQQLIPNGLLLNRNLKHLRWILYAGEECASGLAFQLMEQLPQVRLGNVYGPTETNQCTFYEIQTLTSPPAASYSFPIGQPWTETSALILEGDQVAPPGAKGELAIASPTLMEGYWKREPLNEKVFIWQDTTEGPKRFYRTGDLASWSEKKQLLFHGRIDRQIKIRGYRIELDGIEKILSNHPNIKEAAIYLQSTDKQVGIEAACSVHPDTSSLTAQQIHDYLSLKIPSYSLPEKIRLLSELPRTPSDKIDRQTLMQHSQIDSNDKKN